MYDEIATKLVKNSYENKQIVLIEDLDRVDNKVSVKAFLKELYRFQNSVSSELKDKFVFIIAIKPEALLEGTKNENYEHLYSKVFDVTINLKPIHFEDYESALLAMLGRNEKSKEQLERLIGEKITEEHLPKPFDWILSGENLTLRDLKDRLNHAISIMVSLKNKNYKDVPNISFTACAAVAYLESAFPVCFYKLVQQEEKFETFIRESYPIKNSSVEEKVNNLIQKFNEIFSDVENDGGDINKYDKNFINTICKLVIDNILDDDFRMYFYTYPDNSYVKTVDEKDVCNLIKLSNIYEDFENLDEKVERIFNSRPNSIVINTINNLSMTEPYPLVLILNYKLFELATEHDFEKSLNLLCRYTLKTKTSTEKVLDCLNIVNKANLKRKDDFIAGYVKYILDWFSSGEEIDEQFLELRKNIILAFDDDVILFKTLFVNENIDIPLITEEEIYLINSTNIMLELINKSLVSNNSKYIFERINEKKLSEAEITSATNIYDALIQKNEDEEYLGDILLMFLSVNKIINVTYFDIILGNVNNLDAICIYANSIPVEDLPIEYLRGLDKKAIDNGLNEVILQKLKNNNLFISYLLTKTPLNQIDDIDYSNSNVASSILTACSNIINENEQVFISLRKCIIKKLETVYEMYGPLFEGEYPIITKDELNTFSEFSNAIICIDGSKLDVENCNFVWEYCNQDFRNADNCYKIFDCLFNARLNVKDSDVAKKIFYALDFNKIKFANLTEDNKETVIGFVADLLELNNAEEALKCMRHIETLIPKLEVTIQDSNLINEYIDFLNERKEYTDASIQWIENIELKAALCPEITEQLYHKESYINYVIGKSLYDQALIYDTNLLSTESYLDIYINKPCMFNIMSNNQKFMQDIVKTNLYTKMKDLKLIKPLFRLPQTIGMMEFIWPFLNEDEYSEYLISIPEISTLDDSKAIKVFLCKDENMDRLGSYQLKDKIDYLLWEKHKTHKRDFNKVWNQKWKGKIEKLEIPLL